MCKKGLHRKTKANTDSRGRCRKCRCLSVKAYRLRHPIVVKRRVRASHRTTSGRYSALKTQAKLRGLQLKLTFEQYSKLANKKCFYCGGKLSPCAVGLDRIDSSKGYILGNVRTCCKACNLAKNSLSEKDFKRWVKKIYRHWASK